MDQGICVDFILIREGLTSCSAEAEAAIEMIRNGGMADSVPLAHLSVRVVAVTAT